MPELPDDLARRIRAEADRLEAAAPPIDAAEARSGTAAGTRTRRWLSAAAAVVVLAAAGAAWLLATNDDDPEQLIVPAGSTTTFPTTTTTIEETVDWDSLPEMGIAITAPGRPMRLLDLDGNDLGTMAGPVGTLDGPMIDLPTATAPDPLDPAEVPPGCESAFGGGLIRVALCGDDIQVVDVTGAGRPLYEHHPLDPAGTGDLTGRWAWALPSPDGEWVLAQWQDDCGDPIAVLVAFDDGRSAAVDAMSASASRGLGWTPEGRAVVELVEGTCVRTSPRLGVHLRDPSTLLEGALELAAAVDDPGERAYVWRFAPPANVPERMLFRALDELGLEPFGGEPSHGGPAVTSGTVFEGAEIGITGVPAGDVTGTVIQTMPLLHGEVVLVEAPPDAFVDGTQVVFECGGYTWTLSWFDDGRPEVDSMWLLASYLVPHLYCTLPPAG